MSTVRYRAMAYGKAVLAEQPWNQSLGENFYHARLAGRPAYFYVDRGVIEVIAERNQLAPPGRGCEALINLVRKSVMDAPLGPWVRSAVAWKSSGYLGYPPFLTALAVTVLAATDVELERRANSSYYPQLRSLLNLPLSGGMPKDFGNDVGILWAILNEWLDSKSGALGIPTAKPSLHYVNVGWAMSQVLFPPADRARLPHFFAAMGVDPGEDLPGALLLTQLREVVAKRRIIFSRRFSEKVQRPLDETTSDMLAEALRQELQNWDGTWRREDGEQLVPISIAADEFQGKLHAVFRVPERLAGAVLKFGECEIELGESGDFDFVPAVDLSRLLDGAEIVASTVAQADRVSREDVHFRLAAPQSELRVLSGNDDLGMYVEGNRSEIDVKSIVLVRERLAPEAFDAMSRLGGEDPKSMARLRPPRGWVAFKYRPKRSIALDHALSPLAPRDRFLAHLTGGLCVDGRTRTYLTSGPPDIFVNINAIGGPLVLDGHITLEPDGNGRVRLAEMGLAAGIHKVNAGGRTLTFQLSSSVPSKPFLPVLWRGWDIHQSVGEHRMKFAIANNGSAVSLDSAHDVLVNGASLRTRASVASRTHITRWPEVRSGGRHVALGVPGEAEVIKPEAPGWLAEFAPTVRPRMLDVSKAVRVVGFRPLWVVHEAPHRVEVHRLPYSAVNGTQVQGAEPSLGCELWWSVAERLAEAIVDPQDLFDWSRWLTEAELFELLPEV